MTFRFIEPLHKLADLKMGEKLRTNGRTIVQSDIINYCGIVGDPHSLHLSRIDAEQAPAGRIIAPAPMIQGMAIGLMAQTHWLTPVLVVFLGIDKMIALKPVYPEDTIYVDVSPVSLRETSSGKDSVLRLCFEVYARRSDAGADAEDPKVMEFTVNFLVRD